MLEIQKYISQLGEEKAFKYFKDDLGINIKQSPDGKRVLFKYDQIDSPMGNPICQEARGLILDRSANWRVVSLPFKKFFNYGEGHAAKINLNTACVLEKVDGTCVTLYYFDGAWHIQTLGMIDADGQVNGAFPPITFADLFSQTVFSGRAADSFFGTLSIKYSYTFELATQYNRIITRYEKPRVVLLSIRDMNTLDELPYSGDLFRNLFLNMSSKFPIIEKPASYAVSTRSIEHIANMAAALPQLDEGYVVVDENFNRVKVKNPSYLAIAHLKDSTTSSPKAMVELVLKNDGAEFLSYFPEFTDMYNDISQKIQLVKEKLVEVWESTKEIENQKEFALKIVDSGVPLTDILFKMKKGVIKDIAEGFYKVDPKRMLDSIK